MLIRNRECGHVAQYATNPDTVSSFDAELEGRIVYGTYLNDLYRVAANYMQTCGISNTSHSQTIACESNSYPKSTLRKGPNDTILDTCPFIGDTSEDT